MTWLWIVLAIVIGVPLLLFAVGSFLPRDHVARMSIELNASSDKIWTLVSDLADTPRWRKDISGVTVDSAPGGPVRYVEQSSHGKVPFEIVSQDPPKGQVVRVVDDDQPFGGTWTWELIPAGAGTRVIITEAGFIKNPLFRVMSKLVFKPTNTIRSYLQALARELGELAEPREVAVLSR